MEQRAIAIGQFAFILLFWTTIDVFQARREMRISARDALRVVFHQRVRVMIVNILWAIGLSVFNALVFHDFTWTLADGLAALFYLYWVIRWWWNNRGRQKFAERFGGYKHLARLRRMGVQPQGSS